MLALQRGFTRTIGKTSFMSVPAVSHQKMSAAAMAGAKAGDSVKVHYTGSLDDGSVFDSSRGREPIEFVVGAESVIKGFDTAVTGLNVGETRQSRIPPVDAYGEKDPSMLVAFPAEKAPPGLTEGSKVQLSNGMVATVLGVDDKEVKLDLNHELAGESLTFDVELIGLKK